MTSKKYREYYERLAQARQKQVKKLSEEKKPRSFWSLIYKDSYKKFLYEMILQRMISIKSPIILDVGCGCGGDLAYLSRKHRFRALGIDLSLIRLQAAISTDSLKECKFVQTGVENLPFKDSTFDMVICSEVIEHLPDTNTSLEEMKRVLKQGGLLFLTTPNRWNYFHMLGQLIPKSFRKQVAEIVRGGKFDVDPSEYVPEQGMVEHIHLFTFGELKSDVQDTGFDVEEIKGGMLSVPFPAIFDRYRFLQYLWQGFDRVLSLFPLSRHLKTTILLVGVKK